MAGRKAWTVETEDIPTPAATRDLIAGMLEMTGLRIGGLKNPVCRMLDPCCGDGATLQRLGQHLETRSRGRKAETYGVELNTGMAGEAMDRLNHVICSDLFAASIAHGAFHLLFLNSPQEDDDEGDEQEDRAGRPGNNWLARCTPYLAKSLGVLVLVTNRDFLRRKARYLSTHYQQISCHDMPPEDITGERSVFIIGRRKNEAQANPEAERRIRNWTDQLPVQAHNPEGADQYQQDVPHGPGRYNVYLGAKRKILFSTVFVNPQAMAEEAAARGLWTDPAVIQAFWPAEERKPRPLMPLREGHIGMLVAAGMLDNTVIPTEDGRRIILKGSTRKEYVTKLNLDDKTVKVEQIRTTLTSLDLRTGQITVMKA